MSDAYNKVKEKINNMSFSEYKKNEPPKSKNTKKGKTIKDLLLWRFKVIGAILGVGSSSSSKGISERDHGFGGHPPMPGGGSQGFREGYRFDPEEEILKRRAADAYMQMVDGRGDPPEHDCHCDHDDR